MARVVLVHGAFNELWGPHELKARLLPAVRDGLWHHGVELDERDLDVCFYGDLFRRDPTVADEAFDRTRPGVADQLAAQFAAAGDGGDLAEVLGQAANDALFDRTVDMVTTMAARDDLRDRVHERLAGVVGDDTVVVVAHSLGSIVSYNNLRRHPGWPVRTLITLGSPLGAPTVAPLLDGGAGWPGGVERWVNVAAVGDRAAAVSRLADVFDPRVEDHLVDNGHRAHDPEPYLNNPVTGAALAAALAT